MTGQVPEVLPTGPSRDGHDLGFWEGLRAGELRLPRCASCAAWRTIGRPVCAQCWSFETAWEPVRTHGTVYSWARTWRAFMSELDVDVPYVSIVVALDEAPVRLLGLLVDSDADPAIGDAVTGEIQYPANAEWPILRWHGARSVVS